MRDGITAENAGAAGTVAKAQHGGIEVNEDMLVILHQVAVVGDAVEVLHAVGEGGE